MLLGGGELQALRGLSHLARSLLIELLAVADHASGAITTSWAALRTVLAVDPASNGRARELVTLQRLRDAADELQARGLLRRDPLKNEKTQRLIFRVSGRSGLSAPKEDKNRVPPRCGQPEKPSATRTYKRRPKGSEQGSEQVAQEPSFHSAKHLLGGTYPQGKGSGPIEVGALLQGGPQQAPQGGQTPPAAPARPPAGPSRYALSVQAKLKNSPPSAQADGGRIDPPEGPAAPNTGFEGGGVPRAERSEGSRGLPAGQDRAMRGDQPHGEGEGSPVGIAGLLGALAARSGGDQAAGGGLEDWPPLPY